MKLWWRRGSVDVEKDPRVSEATRARLRAEHDLRQAEKELEATRRQTPAVKALGESLRKLREDNHIAATFRETILRGRP